jgi:hypothetical protein
MAGGDRIRTNQLKLLPASIRFQLRRVADAVAQARHAGLLGAMLAAEEGPLLLQSVADDPDAAILACRRQRMNGAFEAVEGVIAGGSLFDLQLSSLGVELKRRDSPKPWLRFDRGF